ncbi:MAG: hypothetical protein JSR18_09030, partial [Proteobacteria bacterium]|nr:hypothetical protein [Pseudomonadota bacterium]
MPYAEVPGAQIHYRLDGADGAPAIVLSNSLGTDLSLWEPQLPELMRHHRVIRYDQRGHGATTSATA